MLSAVKICKMVSSRINMNLVLDGESNVSLIQSYHSELKKYRNLFLCLSYDQNAYRS